MPGSRVCCIARTAASLYACVPELCNIFLIYAVLLIGVLLIDRFPGRLPELVSILKKHC